MRPQADMRKLPDNLRPLARKLASEGVLKLLRKRLAKYSDDRCRYDQLERLAIEACGGAIEYRERYRPGTADGDDYDVGRQRAASFASELPGYLKTAHKLTSFVRRYKDHIAPSPLYLMKRGVKLSGPKGTNRRELPLIVLGAYEDALLRRLNDQSLGPDMHRYQVGPLYFENAVDNATASQILIPESALLFQLTYFFRCYSASDDISVLQNFGGPMPGAGKPWWSLSAALINATLGTDHAPEALARRMNKLMRRHPKIYFMGWKDEAHWQDPLPDFAEPQAEK